ncbi:MAG: tRNA 4-thiouridine(8) synthase ThiI [Candidatus Gygaella obscura]|nr:tRNA 4-thiouridine(8) synthase ThiI [Candidatus Gygaella obscura]
MKVLVLLSGGLDSALVVKILQSQNIDVVGVNFSTAFTKPIPQKLIESLEIPVKTIKCGKDYLDLLIKPRFGFGRNANPCIDCHIYMLKKAKALLSRLNATFVATGEVLGQRSMSQNKCMLKLIESESGLKGLLLRPLSARLLAPTEVEKKDFVKRDRLLGLSGRGRKVQLQFAKEYKLTGFSQPAGGCFLTDPRYSHRIKDLLKYDELKVKNISLLRMGRHFRIGRKAKFIVGRDKADNGIISEAVKNEDYVIFAPDIAGPIGLARGSLKKDELILCAKIIVYYTKGKPSKRKVLISREKGNLSLSVEVLPETRTTLDRLLI